MRNPLRGFSRITDLDPIQSFLLTVAITLLGILAALIVVLTCFCCPANADDGVSLRDRRGAVIGRVEKGYSGGGIERRVVEDNRGRRLFSIERNNHRTIVRGADGSRIGRYTRDRGIELDEEFDDD